MSFVAVGAGAGYLLGGTATAALVGGGIGAAAGGLLSGGGGGGGTTIINPQQVGQDSLATQIQLAPQQYQAVSTYAPQYAQLQNNILGQQLFGNNGLISLYQKATPQLGALQAQANTQQRTADIADVAKLGGKATAAYNAANPQLTASMKNLSSAVTAAGKAPTPQVNVGAASVDSLGNAATAGTTDAQAALAGVTGAYAQNARGGPLLGAMTRDAAASLNTVSPIQQQLNQQAQTLLDQGGTLSGQDLRTAQQTARSAAAARGIYDSNSAISAEVLNTDAMQRQRLLQNQQQAAAIDAQAQQQIAQNRGYAQNVQGQAQALSQFNAGQQNQTSLANAQFGNTAALANAQALQGASQFNAGQDNAAALANAQAQNQFALANQSTQADLAKFNAGQSYQQQLANAGLTMQAQQQNIGNLSSLASMYASQAQDPYQLVLGRSGASSQAMSAVGQAGGMNYNAPTFDPFNSNITSIYAGNAANQTAANIAAGNNRSAMNGQILGTLGTLGAAYMMCWAARAAFGERDPRWLVARRWMLRRAPHWLRRLYVRHGMRLAAAIDGSPALRAEYRALFRRLVAGDTAARHELGASLLALAA